MKTILAFGAHPDDVEIGCSGTLSKEARLGNRVIIIDLTDGKMGTNGNPEQRLLEGELAAKIIGAEKRINLKMEDRRILIDDAHIRKVAAEIRKWQPDIVLSPYYHDRHPDHEQASKLIREAIFDAGCAKNIIEDLKVHKVQKLLYYYINDVESANLYLDISEDLEVKRATLLCHESQFVLAEGRVPTVLNSGYVEHILNRDKYNGYLAGTVAAEAFKFEKPILVDRI